MAFVDGLSIQAVLAKLSIPEILDAASPFPLAFPHEGVRNDLLELVRELPITVQFDIRHAAAMKTPNDEYEGSPDFLLAPGTADVENALTTFEAKFKKDHLRRTTCCICARTLLRSETVPLKLNPTEHVHILLPGKSHVAHQLQHGMLLHNNSDIIDAGFEVHGFACLKCNSSIASGITPPMALANAMWVGDVPPELQNLSLAERSVIARCHRVKYNISIDQTSDSHSIDMVPLPPKLCVDKFVSVHVPPDPSQLAALFNIRTNGEDDIMDVLLIRKLTINRSKVKGALQWLKNNNRFYADIEIDDLVLGKYPICGVPDVLSAGIMLSQDVSVFFVEYEDDTGDFETSQEGPTVTIINDPSSTGFNRLAMTYFDLAPFGEGFLTNDRAVGCSLHERVRYALDYEDGRFARDAFICEAFWDIQEIQARRVFQQHLAITPFSYDAIDLDDVEDALDESDSRSSSSNVEIEAVVGAATLSVTDTLGSRSGRKRFSMRLNGTILQEGPPSIYLAINPFDRLYPVSRVIAGIDMDMESVDQSYVEDADLCLREVKDDFVSTKLFNMLATWIIRDLLGISSHHGHIYSRVGILGRLSTYVVGVGTNADGALHLNMFLWMKGAPNFTDMQIWLRSDAFRERIVSYIGDIVQTDITGRESTHSRCQAYQLQSHICSQKNCQPECYHVARLLSKTGWADETGNYGPAQFSRNMIPWVPALMEACPTTHTFELLTHGRSSLHRTAALSHIANASNARSHMTRHTPLRLLWMIVQSSPGSTSNADHALVIALINLINRYTRVNQRLKVMYIMGWGDNYLSHVTVPFSWEGMVGLLRDAFPSLGKHSSNYAKRHRVEASISFIRSYGTRDPEFSNMNLLDFTLRTRPMLLQSGEWGLPGQDGTKYTKRVLRSTYVKTVLESAFPVSLGDDITEIHYAAKLALYRNWHHITDILGSHDTFKGAFTSFMMEAPRNIVEGIDNLTFIRQSSAGFEDRIV